MENIVNHFHPENANTFLRNIIMARRLDTVAKNITGLKQMQGKPQIGINIHARHGGVEDLLIIQDKLGSRAVLKLLDLYSNKTLKAVVKENGRHEDTLEQNIKTTSTGLVFSVKDAVQGETKHLLVDTELENYLLGRLGE